MVDQEKFKALLGKVMGDLGGAWSVALVRLGDRLGLYKALHKNGPMTSLDLAAATGLHERYVREWLSHQAVSGYVAYHSDSGKFELPEEQALVFASEDSPANLLGGFDGAVAMMLAQEPVEAAFKKGGGVAWGDQSACLFCATARFFRPGYLTNLVGEWLPSLDGVVEKLRRGAKVADIGCGHGVSTVTMAKAFPNSRFVGYDFHPSSVAAAKVHATEHGVIGNTCFEVATAKDFSGVDFDLIGCFDCLHDMGDPAGAAAHIRRALKPDGTWMIIEPLAGDRLEENFNPVSRLYYAASTLVCVPSSLAQEVGTALGAQAGEARLREVIGKGGFSRIRRSAQSATNMILEARP